MKKNSKIFVVIGIILLCLVGFFVYKYLQDQHSANINSYDECVEAGYPVFESYPAKCQLPDGQSFTQVIEGQNFDEIKVENPVANQKILSPLEVKGEAVGTWFFEGSTSGELFDESDNSLGIVILTAQGNWMTEDFVPFEGTMEFTQQPAGAGKLIIKNANPSEMPENVNLSPFLLRFKYPFWYTFHTHV